MCAPTCWSRCKALSPAFIRWPGGNVAQDYHWQLGRRSARRAPDVDQPVLEERAGAERLRHRRIHQRSPRNVGAEPSITVNVEGRGATPEEAAAWVEYCNGPATSTYGKMRAANGHPEPYGVQYWEIGNEIWGDWVRGHSDATTYARNFNRYVAGDARRRSVDRGHRRRRQRHGVEPHRAAAGHRRASISWRSITTTASETWTATSAISRRVRCTTRSSTARSPLALHELPPDRRPRLAINEWGLDLPEPRQYSMLGALYAARLMNVFERRSDVLG